MKKIIAHRANLNGPSPKENTLNSIFNCLHNYNYDVEIDLFLIEKHIHIGHDLPTQTILTTKEFLELFYTYRDRLWLHCKNIESLIFFLKIDEKFNFFGHNNDEFTLTSTGEIFARPGIMNKNITCVMPEIINANITTFDFNECKNILTDYPIKYETHYNTIRA